jgi:acetyltransferase-like isoleucine patch superfamily enzyme
MLEVILTREDANTEFALVASWLVPDGSEVADGQPICVVETTKAAVELVSPGAGLLVHLYGEGDEVELGTAVGLVAQTEDELMRWREQPVEQDRAPVDDRPRRATRKAAELAERHGIDLGSIVKRGFITAEDVEALVRGAAAGSRGTRDPILAGVSTDGVTLPDSFGGDPDAGRLEAGFLAQLRDDPESVRSLAPEAKTEAYRAGGALIGDGVTLDFGALVVAERVVIGDRARIGTGATVECAEVFAVGELTHVGPGLELRCRRAFLGANIHAGRSIRVGGGGHRDPWATLAVGDLTFIGDEVFVNPCRPVLIGREVFLTQRSTIVTHNIGHSVLEGYENRFAPVVVEDRAQVGIGTVVYAGCRIGRGAIVASSSYVVSDIPSGKLAIGVPAKVVGDAHVTLSHARQVERARRIVHDLHELLELRGHAVSEMADGATTSFEVETEQGAARVIFAERVAPGELSPAPGGTVALTLDYAGGEPPEGCAVLALLARELHGDGGAVVDTVREFCRKCGIRFEPGPWRYGVGLI